MRKRLTPATVLAVVALFVALAGTATAAGVKLITGAEIKNGSIGLVDLSAGAKRALKGNRGPTGPQGQEGPPGAQGAQGAQGPPGVQAVKAYSASGTIAPGTIHGFFASCPAGEGIISGGVFTSAGYIFSDRRVGNGWGIGVDNSDYAVTANATVYLYCSPGVSALSMPNGAMSSFRAQIDAYREASQ